MNRRPLFLKPQKAVLGFLQQKTAEGLSPTTCSPTLRLSLLLFLGAQGDRQA
jgi:hypothetical protein